MNRKISRNEKHMYSNEEKSFLGKDENTSALINIARGWGSFQFFPTPLPPQLFFPNHPYYSTHPVY